MPVSSITPSKVSKLDAWKEVSKSYKLYKALGQGSYGTVLKAKSLDSSAYVAIKHMTGFSKNEYHCVKVIREIQIMKSLKDGSVKFFPKLLDLILVGDDHIFLVMELETTDIRTLLKNSGKIDFKEGHLKNIIYNILCSVSFMNSSNIVHRDLKPGNILVNDQC